MPKGEVEFSRRRGEKTFSGERTIYGEGGGEEMGTSLRDVSDGERPQGSLPNKRFSALTDNLVLDHAGNRDR